ncbi:hypothetical protein [Actinomyces glycerinitolerans]|uniref:Uncharacterized protein n=1 Tax=Actinomyces glycerinitolerans TaxID=1892869 RepID=A0A1M4RWA2_9ACTO|nr:hypothetical protein [Actinomyces glycerinitolerans]SHE24262.1 Hypothetical protein ACGLYG10_0462 [Actinomyces glycerinitolerans]
MFHRPRPALNQYDAGTSTASRAVPPPERIVARPNRRARTRGCLIVFMGLLPIAAGIAVLAIGEIEGGLLLVTIGVLVVFLGTAPWREYTIFDADGIHSHTTLRDIDAPWPDSRAAFVVRQAYGKYFNTAYVVAPSTVGSFKLAAPRVVGGFVGDIRAQVETEVDEIWAWAVDRGYVPGAARHRGHKRRRRRKATAPGRPMNSRGDAPAAEVFDDAESQWQKPVVFSAWSGQRWEIIWHILGTLALGGGGVGYAFYTLSRSGIDSVAGKLGFAIGLLMLIVAVRVLPDLLETARARLTVYAEGIDYFSGMYSFWIDWPTSRSSIFVAETEEYRRTVVEVRILAAEGLSVSVPGLRWLGGGDRALLAAAAAADSIWEMGVASGFAVDDGGYQPAADPECERRRVAVARRIEYLNAQG